MENSSEKTRIEDVDVPKEEINAWICKICDGVKTLLLQRQEHYGNTIGEPLRVASKLGPLARARVYIDHKLARLAKGDTKTEPDSLSDEIGYSVLMRSLQYAQGYKFTDPLDIYIKFNETNDAKLIEEDRRFSLERNIRR